MGAGRSKAQDLTYTDPGILKNAHCSSSLKTVVNKAGHSPPPLQCPPCPAAHPLCEQCLYPCLSKGTATCTNNSCHLVATLLSCDLVTDPKSQVKGCPVFRACPKCHNLMMHTAGCKYVACTQCRHAFCFICLQNKAQCIGDIDHWSLTCSKPTAPRQRFQT
ncbi:putative E3 ubiquitin-protein ligase RNF144A-B [Astyanax mexicanus]|uniref:Putative E3 ubiquitin-protein ligase RNF144A-B n=1 Tax=Astyanax mexicanus TaxID=7994 RepID=A0A8T2MJF5_ASTMX|nr:putative E3 ubiquitin-protein ligase RNF144A-B [Astyanax mexicanus]